MIRTLKILSLLAIAFFLLKSPGAVEAAVMENIDIFSEGGELLLDASLRDGFSEEVVEAINSGVPVGITYTVVLKRKVPLFFDSQVALRKIARHVKYDTLKEEYALIDSNGNEKTKKITGNFDEVVQLMTRLESIKLISKKRIKQKGKYYVKVKAELDSKKTWFPFSYILFFIPFLNFDTSWESSSPISFK